MPDSVRITQRDTHEVGRPGTRIFSGSIQTDEYLSQFMGTAKYDKYDEMKYSDPLVSGLLKTIKDAIMASEWDIEVPGNTDADKERTDEIRKNLIESGLFYRSLPELLLLLDNGFSAVETVYGLRGKTLFLDKLAARSARTITGWFSDKAMRVITEVEQDPGVGVNSRVLIPARKMVVLTHNGTGLNMEGVSLLRPMYKPWYYKTNVEQILAVKIERMTGVPYATYPKNSQKEGTADDLEALLKNFTNHEQNFLMTDNETEIKLLESSGAQGIDGFLEYFRYQDQAMAISALAQFAAAIGSGTSGISETKPLMDLFLAAQQAVCKSIESAMNDSDPRLKDQVAPIEKLIRYNHGPKVKVPKLRCSKVTALNLQNLSGPIKEMLIAGGLEPDDPLEDFTRKVMGLPPKDPSTVRKQQSTGTNMVDNSREGAKNVKPRS